MAHRVGFAHGEFSWVDAIVHDRAAAQSFYEHLFGWSCRDAGGDQGHPYAFFHVAGQLVAGLGEMDEGMRASGMPAMWNSYVNVDDLDAVLARVPELGGRLLFPAEDVPGSGRLAFVQDPTGAALGLWEPGGHSGSQIVSEPNAFCWNELATRDADAARDFYAGLLGWTYRLNPQSPATYHVVENQGRDNGGILQMTEEWGEMPSHWNVYFAVADLESSLNRLRDSGGQVHHGPFETPVGRIAVTADPQGAVFHLIQLSRPIG